MHLYNFFHSHTVTHINGININVKCTTMHKSVLMNPCSRASKKSSYMLIFQRLLTYCQTCLFSGYICVITFPHKWKGHEEWFFGENSFHWHDCIFARKSITSSHESIEKFFQWRVFWGPPGPHRL